MKIKLALKNVVNRYALLKLSKTNARNVLKPPLKTAGPIIPIVATILSKNKNYRFKLKKRKLRSLMRKSDSDNEYRMNIETKKSMRTS